MSLEEEIQNFIYEITEIRGKENEKVVKILDHVISLLQEESSIRLTKTEADELMEQIDVQWTGGCDSYLRLRDFVRRR